MNGVFWVTNVFASVEKVTKRAYDSKISELEDKIRALAEEKALLECKQSYQN